MAIPNAGRSVRVDTQEFTSSGTWTKPSWADEKATVEYLLIGGGGAGHATNSMGGQAGGVTEGVLLASDLGSTETVTIGAGGSGGDGGDTSFGDLSAGGGIAGFASPPTTVEGLYLKGHGTYIGSSGYTGGLAMTATSNPGSPGGGGMAGASAYRKGSGFKRGDGGRNQANGTDGGLYGGGGGGGTTTGGDGGQGYCRVVTWRIG